MTGSAVGGGPAVIGGTVTGVTAQNVLTKALGVNKGSGGGTEQYLINQ